MKIKILSWEQLAGAGWKETWHKLFIGRERQSERELPVWYKSGILGKEFKVLRTADLDSSRPSITIKSEGKERDIPLWLVDSKEDLLVKLKPKRLQVGKKNVYYHPDGTFEFPCYCSDMPKSEARKIAKWVLKVSSV